MKESWKPGNMLYPLPAVMVSCGAEGKKPNIITVAWAGTVCSDPAMVSISVRKERYSHALLAESREFVINLVPAGLAGALDFCGVKSGRDTDKFAERKLTAAAVPELQWAPAIEECPVNILCRVKQILELGSHDMFLAEVAGVRVDSSLLDEKGSLNLEKADLLCYSHGGYYALGKKLGTFGFSVKKPKGKTKK